MSIEPVVSQSEEPEPNCVRSGTTCVLSHSPGGPTIF
jgi:hypothetical protein